MSAKVIPLPVAKRKHPKLSRLMIASTADAFAKQNRCIPFGPGGYKERNLLLLKLIGTS